MASFTISQSVGDVQADGTPSPNNEDDVLLIQFLLNRVPLTNGGPAVPLPVNGLAGVETLAAIHFYEITNFFDLDGRVDPNDRTMTELRLFAPSEFEGITDVVELGSIIRAPLPDWDFTRGNFHTLTALAGLQLTFDSFDSWLPPWDESATYNHLRITSYS